MPESGSKFGRVVALGKLRVAACSLALAALMCGACEGRAQSGGGQWANEYELKAAFVYRLMSFVEWPGPELGDHVIVGFAGEGPMKTALARYLQGKRIGRRPIEVREVRNQSDLRACNVLVLAYPDGSRMREALKQLKNTSVLTIGDGENFARMGGVIALVPGENTFQLAINPQAAERAQIKISSKLLSMAKLLSDEELP
jgi:hypothetical protein